MRPRTPIRCAAALLAATLTLGAAAQTPVERPVPAADHGVDTRISPGDDFFGYANGEWLQAHDIPPGMPRWDARTEIAQRTRERINQLLADAARAPAGSSARQVADFQAAYLDEATIEARGGAALKALLAPIDRLHDKAALTRLLGRGLRADVDPMNQGVYRSQQVLGLAVQAGMLGEPTHSAFLLQGGLGLVERERYLADGPQHQALRDQYQATIGRLLALAGTAQAVPRAHAVMALETALARSHATLEASSEDRNAENVWTRADFARQAPGMDWPAFFNAAGLGRQASFVVWQPEAVQGLAALVASQPLQAWQDYLRIQAMWAHADVLPRAVAEPVLAMRTALSNGATRTRTQRALDATQAALSDAIGQLYVQRHFPPDQKRRVEAIAARVIAAFSQRVQAVTWMSPATRAQALAKLQRVHFGIGHPDRWPDAAGLRIDPKDAVGNLRRVAEHQRRQALARLGQPVDRGAWGMPAQRPGAVLLFHLNAYNFAAALLQPPKFDPDASDAANYGAIGAIIGHELSHFIDTLGADYDADGRLRRWWAADDLARYQAWADPLVRQFGGYQPLAQLSINGQLTLTENLADLGGLAAAFDAHRAALAERAGDAEFLRQQDRQFFIGFARAWRSKARDEATRTQIASDGHAPERFRVATVRNLDAWYEAFDVQPGQRLYLEPKARIRGW